MLETIFKAIKEDREGVLEYREKFIGKVQDCRAQKEGVLMGREVLNGIEKKVRDDSGGN